MAAPVIIVGAGLAGLFCALRLAPTPVTVLAAAPLCEGASSAWAQGGIAAAMAEGDSAEQHAADTVAAGAGLVDAAAALAMAREAPERIRDLLALGVPFDRDLAGRLVQSREAAHAVNRIVRVQGDAAGAAIMRALAEAVRRTPSIRVRTGAIAEELVMRDGRVVGVSVRDEGGTERRATIIPAAAVVLATGGIGHLFAVTTNPAESSGQGLAMAARAGAVIADAEFVQFHPTALDVGRDPAPLATEALRGEGAVLVDSTGRRFMPDLHPEAELAPRDTVARGVFASIMAGRGAFLDASEAIGGAFATRFPTVHAACLAAGIDPAVSRMPVAPAAHYHMGGIATDGRGRTSLPGLWAIGEVASTGIHGANRLASNSLLEAVVFAARAAADLRAVPLPVVTEQETVADFSFNTSADWRPDGLALRRLMTDRVGVLRDADGLAAACAEILRLEAEAPHPALRNRATAALLVAAAAFARRETRGGHARTDWPAADPAQARRSRLTLPQARGIALSAVLGAGLAGKVLP